jgi:dolichol-phosphate mannosyltransferase
MKNKVYISTVIYLHNDEDIVCKALKDISNFLDKHFEHFEVICVDDCSSDKTLEKVLDLIPHLKGYHNVISLTRKHGIETAMLAGGDKSIGDFIYEIELSFMDYSLDFMLELFNKAQSGFDIVAGREQKIPLVSNLFYFVLKLVSYVDMDLNTENIIIVSRRALNAILDMPEKTRYRKGLLYFTGFPKAECIYRPIKYIKRKNRSISEKLQLALEIIISFSRIGSKMPLLLSMIFLCISIFTGVLILCEYIWGVSAEVRGWTTLMAFLSFGFFGTFLVLGFLGEYISMILIELQGRPLYTIKKQYHSFNKQKDSGVRPKLKSFD